MKVFYKACVPIGHRYKVVSGEKEYSDTTLPNEIKTLVQLELRLKHNTEIDYDDIEIEELKRIDCKKEIDLLKHQKNFNY